MLHDNLKGLNTFFGNVAAGTLPEASFVVPKNLDSGHPGYSAPACYEAFLAELIAKVQANPELYASTAIIITTDEGADTLIQAIFRTLISLVMAHASRS